MAKRLAVVTGSNKGIGLEIVRGLASRDVLPVLTARDVQKGQEAVDALQKDGLEVVFHQLDVTIPQSVDDFAAWIRDSYGGFDILINNAGLGGPDLNAMMETNYYGVKRMIRALSPLMRSKEARIINISSVAGTLELLQRADWKQKLQEVDTLQEEIVDRFVTEYLEQGMGKTGEGRWTSQIPIVEPYTISKMALSAFSRICAREMKDVLVCCACPGLTNTDMTNAGHPPAVGADNAVWLATAPPSELVTGAFYVNRQSVGFTHIPLFVDGKMLPDVSQYVACMQEFFGRSP